MAMLLHEQLLPAGLIRTFGLLQYQRTKNRSIIQTLKVSGNLTSSQLAFTTSTAYAEVQHLTANYMLANGDAYLRDLHAEILGGELAAHGVTQSVGGDSHSNYRAELHRVSLAAIRNALGASAAANDAALAGKANATVTAIWGKIIDDMVAHCGLTVNAQAQRSHVAGARTVAANWNNLKAGNKNQAIIPINGVFHATYKNGERKLEFNDSYLRSSQTNVDLNSAVGSHSSLSVRLQANDLSEVAAIVDLFRAHGNSQLDLAGRASFRGTVQESTVAPHLTGQLNAENLRFNDTNWKKVRAGSIWVQPMRPYKMSIWNRRNAVEFRVVQVPS
jgi:hypothetical protein